MPTRKQRRRQQKTRRHEWEYVYVDDEGNEVEVDPEQLSASKNGKAQPRERKSQTRAAAGRSGRTGRTIEPPSWRRVGRRALLIGPVVVVAMLLLNRNLPMLERVVPAIIMLAFFLPFSYFTDSLAYRMYRRRIDRTSGGSARGAKSS
jgi:hypothetical protein